MSDINKLINEEIKNTLDEVLKNDDYIKNTIEENLRKAIKTAIENAFRWGDIKNAIENKIKETMTPAIEKYDFSAYITKLDVMLTEIANDPDVMANKRILENFKTMITPPNTKTIPIETIFKAYCDFVSKNIETDGRDVIFEDGPSYEPVPCRIEIENIKSPYISNDREKWRFTFLVDEDDAKAQYNDEINYDIEFYRYGWFNKNEYAIRILTDPKTLNNMSEFEAYINSLISTGIHITTNTSPDCLDISEEVIPEKEPEATFS